MVVDKKGVVKLLPVEREDPPVGAAYQLTTPADEVAPKVTIPPPDLEPGKVLTIVGVPIEAVTDVLEVLEQPVLYASAQ